jgi:hypothetical protein
MLEESIWLDDWPTLDDWPILEDIGLLDETMLEEKILEDDALLDETAILLDAREEDSVGTYGAFLLVGIVPLAGRLSGSICLWEPTYSRSAL